MLLAAVLMLGLTPGHTEEKQYRFELTPFIGYRVGGEFVDAATDTGLDVENANSFGLIFNIDTRDFDVDTQWEIMYSHQQARLQTAAILANQPVLDLDIDYLHFGGTYVFDGNKLRPYVAATVGVSYLDPVPAGFDSETFFSFAIGGGIKWWPYQRVGVRLEGRVFSTLTDSDSSVFCRTGPTANVCAIEVSGDALLQGEASAGLIVRF